MFVDLLERRVFEGFVGALLRFRVVDLREHRAVLDDLDAGELLEDPPLGSVVGALGLFASEPLVQCEDVFEWRCPLVAWAVPAQPLIARLDLDRKARLLLHCNPLVIRSARRLRLVADPKTTDT